MSQQKATQAISNAVQELTIKKISDFKARKGYKIVQVKYIPGVSIVTDRNQRILGRGYFWNEKGERELCYALEIPADIATPVKRLFENEKAEHRRKYRHRIWNDKHTKKIMCPFTNSCSKCPFADRPEEILSSEAEEYQELSFDEVNEDKLSVPDKAFGSEKSIFYGLQEEEMLETIKSDDEAAFIKLVSLNRQGYELTEIMEKLNLLKEDVERLGHKLEKYMDNYIG